jgi:hypothetical protein
VTEKTSDAVASVVLNATASSGRVFAPAAGSLSSGMKARRPQAHIHGDRESRRVIGSTLTAFPTTNPYSLYDVGATVYQALGVDPGTEIRDPLNRPSRLNTGQTIRELFQDS